MRHLKLFLSMVIVLIFLGTNVQASGSSATGGIVADWYSGDASNLTIGGILIPTNATVSPQAANIQGTVDSKLSSAYTKNTAGGVVAVANTGAVQFGVNGYIPIESPESQYVVVRGAGAGNTNCVRWFEEITGYITSKYDCVNHINYVQDENNLYRVYTDHYHPGTGGGGGGTVDLSNTSQVIGTLGVGSGGTGATTPIQARKNLNVTNITNARDYGAIGNGVHDDITAIQGAIDSLGDTGGIVDPGCPGNFSISTPIKIGNGNESAKSTVNKIVLKGNGLFGTSDAEMFDSPESTCNIYWAGAINESMIYINGSTYGNGVVGLSFDGAGKAGTILNITHNFGGKFQDLHMQKWLQYAIDINAYDNPQGGVVNGANNNIFDHISAINPSSTYANGMRVGSNTNAASPSLAVSQNTYNNMALTRGSGSGSASLILRFTDASVFTSVIMQTSGDANDGYALDIQPPSGFANATNFPNQIAFISTYMLGAVHVAGTWTPSQKMAMYPVNLGDFPQTLNSTQFTGTYSNGVIFGSTLQMDNGAYINWVYNNTPRNVFSMDAVGAVMLHSGGGNGFYVYNNTSVQLMRILENGNVMIGQGTPNSSLTVMQYTSSDPIADDWRTYSSDSKQKTIKSKVEKNETVYLNKTKAWPSLVWNRTAQATDAEVLSSMGKKYKVVPYDEAFVDMPIMQNIRTDEYTLEYRLQPNNSITKFRNYKYIDVPTGKMTKALRSDVIFNQSDGKFYTETNFTSEEIEDARTKIIKHKERLPKFKAVRVGGVLDDVNVPEEIVERDADGKIIGYSMLGFVLFQQESLREAAIQIEELDKRLKDHEKIK